MNPGLLSITCTGGCWLSITRTGGCWMLQALHQTVAAVGWWVARAGRLPRPSLCELALSLSLQFFTFT